MYLKFLYEKYNHRGENLCGYSKSQLLKHSKNEADPKKHSQKHEARLRFEKIDVFCYGSYQPMFGDIFNIDFEDLSAKKF